MPKRTRTPVRVYYNNGYDEAAVAAGLSQRLRLYSGVRAFARYYLSSIYHNAYE
jgi:hypothetical protein